MRRAAAFLALLLCLYWTRAQGESGGVTGNHIAQTEVQSDILGVIATGDQTNITPDIWAELKELRDMAVKHSVELTVMETRMSASEKEVEQLKIENAVLKLRLDKSEKEVEELKTQNAAMETRMNTSEKDVEELQRQNADLQSRVTAFEDKSTVMETRMNTNENDVEELQRQNADRPKVAFSLGLTNDGHVGPFDTAKILQFRKVFSNFGQGYNPATGVFTAPVTGVYYFSFTAVGNRTHKWSYVFFYYNHKSVLLNRDLNGAHGYTSFSNSLVLRLEKGDVVYMKLPANNAIFDTSHNLCTFNGFLLFPL